MRITQEYINEIMHVAQAQGNTRLSRKCNERV